MNVTTKIWEIVSLDWSALSSEEKMYALFGISQAFSISLKNALLQDPENQALKSVAEEELKTTNLSSEELWISDAMDHREYLQHFIEKEGIDKIVPQKLKANVEVYLSEVALLKDNVAIIANCEKRFEPVIEKILQDNELTKTLWFRHFWEAHHELDGAEWWHGDQLATYANDNSEDSIRFFDWLLTLLEK